MQNNHRYKTSLCKFYKEDEEGSCRMGERCIFAHGEDELKKSPYPYQQNNGYQHQNNGYNNYRNNNNEGGYQRNFNNKKTVECRFFKEGDCKYGDNCNYAHGVEELRQVERNPEQNNNNYGNQENFVNQGEETFQKRGNFQNQRSEDF